MFLFVVELEHLLAHAEARIKLIVTDGVFSMDGNVAPLKGLRDLADKYRALLAVDDSHATGFFGETGRWVAGLRIFYMIRGQGHFWDLVVNNILSARRGTLWISPSTVQAVPICYKPIALKKCNLPFKMQMSLLISKYICTYKIDAGVSCR